MKKFLMITLTLFLCLTAYAVSNDDKFMNALKNCNSYQESGTVNIQGISADSSKSISGWQDGKCIYKENISINGMNTNVVCKFSRQQINELSSVIDAYFLTLKYSNETPEFSSLESIQNNPVANAFNKYLQDSSTCSIGGIE